MSKRFRRNRYRERMRKSFSTLPTPIEGKLIVPVVENVQHTDLPEVDKVGNQMRIQLPGPPPDYIYKNRQNRVQPANEVWGAGGTVSYIPYRFDFEKGKGCYVNWYQVPFRSRCVAPVQAIFAMSPVKRLVINVLIYLSQITKSGRLTRLFDLFNGIAAMTMNSFLLEDDYYCPTAKAVRSFIRTFLIELGVEEKVADRTGEIIGCFFEYDNAYRTRVQDLAGEVNLKALLKNMPKELERLIQILASRETVIGGGENVVHRFKSGVKVLKWIWFIPSMKRRFRKAINAMDIESMKLDEADIYHNVLYNDYNIQGKKPEERLKILEGYHGPDQSKWPPRILIK